MTSPTATIECQVCHQHFKVGEVINAHLIEEPIVQRIREKQGTWSPEGYICLGESESFQDRVHHRHPHIGEPGGCRDGKGDEPGDHRRNQGLVQEHQRSVYKIDQGKAESRADFLKEGKSKK